MNEFEGHPMAGTQNANDPFFSADGEWVGFFTGGKLKKISIFGGTPQEICDVGGVLRGGWWAEDNTIWYGHINRAIHKVSASGGSPTEVTALDTTAKEISQRFPQTLPGGKGLLFTVKKSSISSFDEAEIAVEVLSTHEPGTLIMTDRTWVNLRRACLYGRVPRFTLLLISKIEVRPPVRSREVC
jgi:hypothetical protein